MVHDNHGGFEETPIPGIIRTVFPFFAYVVGNPGVRAAGATRAEVLDRIRASLIIQKEKGAHVSREIVELDLGDHVLAEDVMGD
jgi:hypothetical protein